MDKIKAGLNMIRTSALLISAKYIAAAIYMTGTSERSKDLFSEGMKYTGSGLVIAAGLALFVGLVLVILGEVDRNGGKE